MIPFRRLLADRSGAFAMIAIIAQLFVLQTISAGYACAGMDAARAMGTSVICQNETSASGPHGSGGPNSHDCCIDCPCAIGCGHAPSILPAVLGEGGLAMSSEFGEAGLSWPLTIDALGPRAPPSGLAYKRGPPLLSV